MKRSSPGPQAVSRPRAIALLAALIGVLAAAACGGSSKSNTPNITAPTARDAQVTVDDVNGAKASPECAAKVKTLRIVTYGNISASSRNAKDFLEKTHPGLKVDLSSNASSSTGGGVRRTAGRQRRGGAATAVASAV